VEGVKKVFDVAVIGAGPAGSAAAITAAREGFAVALLESGSFPRHKVCGEFVSGEALPILKSLIPNDELLARAPRIRTARLFLDDRGVDFVVEPAAVSLSRHALDQRLWDSAIAEGVWASDRARVAAVRKEQSFFSIESKGSRLRARAVVNASGRWSNLSRPKAEIGDSWIGLKQHFIEDNASLRCDLYFFRGGYCGVQALGNGTINVAAMVRADLARTLTGVFGQNRELAARSRNWHPASEAVATSPLLFSAPRTSDKDTVLVGDAAAFIDPFAGDGISMALHSGRLAALSLAPYLREEYSLGAALEKYDSAYRELLQPALKAAARLRRLLQLPKTLRLTALSLLQWGPLARLAVQQTRVRMIA
jgi:flavin-dependent dehydrogenase